LGSFRRPQFDLTVSEEESQDVLGIPFGHSFRLFGGRADPKDPSHFTIEYEVSGERGTIDGWLMPSDTVKLHFRTPPLPPFDARLPSPPAQGSATITLVTIKVNGQNRQLADGTTVAELIAQHKLTPSKVAVELNQRLIRAEKYDTALKAGDAVEIVTFVGGG
jgi:thiamine biosynthesis protein ThiS